MGYNQGCLIRTRPDIRAVLRAISQSPAPIDREGIREATASQLTYAELVHAVHDVTIYKMAYISKDQRQGHKIKRYGPVYSNIEQMLDKYTDVEVQP